MTLTKITLVLGGALIALTVSYFLFANAVPTYGSAPSGLPATVATTSNPVVGTTAVTIIATSSACTSRIISTGSYPIMLTFSDYANQTPTGSFGFFQGASTTVAYDSGIYGCGLVKAYGYTGNINITVSETR